MPENKRPSACVSYAQPYASLTFITSKPFFDASQWKMRFTPAQRHHSMHLQHGHAVPNPCLVNRATYRSAPFTRGSRRRMSHRVESLALKGGDETGLLAPDDLVPLLPGLEARVHALYGRPYLDDLVRYFWCCCCFPLL